jgi:hypothetical protein
MIDLPKPTPTCTRFQATTEIDCIKCNDRMKLVRIEPRDGKLDILTYRCTGCFANESFLKLI